MKTMRAKDVTMTDDGIPVERMAVETALYLAGRIADPEDEAREAATVVRDVVDVLRCEVLRLRAIVEGRDAPPTIKQALAHSHGARGAFVVMLGDGAAHYSARVVTGLQRFWQKPQRWWALDAAGRPCEWPKTGEGE